MAGSTGRVTQIQGAVIDCAFPPGDMPEIYEAIEVDREDGSTLVLEVQLHLGEHWVRTVAMDSTDGIQRGLPARATGAAIKVPVGEPTLGRMFNVLPSMNAGRLTLPRFIRSIAQRLPLMNNPHALKFLKLGSR
jgi:F-type H+-transporting ATPase subunit beta